jgi:hypothetical protein
MISTILALSVLENLILAEPDGIVESFGMTYQREAERDRAMTYKREAERDRA